MSWHKTYPHERLKSPFSPHCEEGVQGVLWAIWLPQSPASSLSGRDAVNQGVSLGECWFWRTITESVDLSKEVAAIIFIYGGCVCDFSRLFYFVLNKYSFWN